MSETIKIVLLGETSVGKTSIISRFASNSFNPNTLSSLSAQFVSKTVEIDGKSLKLDLWDTAGQEKYRALAKIFYKDARVICLVYDITNKKSFEAMKDFWYEKQTKLNVEGDPIFAVVGNKNDLYEIRQIEDEGKNFAKSIGAIFQYTSAKNSSGIKELFNKIGEKIFNPNIDFNEQEDKDKELYEKKKLEKAQKKNEDRNKGVRLDNSIHQQKIEKKGCC